MRSLKFILLILTLSIISCEKKEDGSKAKYRDITEAVYSTVTVLPVNMYTVFPPVNGIIEFSKLKEGLDVKNGQTLLSISNKQSDINEQNAKLNYDLARENFNGDAAILYEIEESINAVKIRLANDSINLVRQERLWNQDIGSQQSYDSKKLAFQLSKNELARLIHNYNRTKKELAKKMELAENSIALSKANRQDFIVKSKMNGIVYEVLKEVGEAVGPQTPIAVIGSKEDFLLELLVDEQDISRVYNGQKIIITLDAYGEQTFEGTLSKIYPAKDERSQTFTVEALFTEKPNRLYKGLSGEANIIVSEKKHVLSLPTQLLSKDNTVSTDDGLVNIKTGISNLQFTEIVSGIDTSTMIYKPK